MNGNVTPTLFFPGGPREGCITKVMLVETCRNANIKKDCYSDKKCTCSYNFCYEFLLQILLILLIKCCFSKQAYKEWWQFYFLQSVKIETKKDWNLLSVASIVCVFCCFQNNFFYVHRFTFCYKFWRKKQIKACLVFMSCRIFSICLTHWMLGASSSHSYLRNKKWN